MCCETLNIDTTGAAESTYSWIDGTFSQDGTTVRDNLGTFPVYRQLRNSNVYLSHDASPASFANPWGVAFSPSNSPGDGVYHLRMGPSGLRCPRFNTGMFFWDWRNRRYAAAEGQVTCATGIAQKFNPITSSTK